MKTRIPLLLVLMTIISLIQISISEPLHHNNFDHMTGRVVFHKQEVLADLCTADSCKNGGICIKTPAKIHQCKCVGPWRGVSCDIVDRCHNSPCLNGGACQNTRDDYMCKCLDGYHGTNCEKVISGVQKSKNYCQQNPCNTGQCISLETKYYCQCPRGRHGEHCEKYSNPQPFYHLITERKRNKHKQNFNPTVDDSERAFYDFRNGLYF